MFAIEKPYPPPHASQFIDSQPPEPKPKPDPKPKPPDVLPEEMGDADLGGFGDGPGDEK